MNPYVMDPDPIFILLDRQEKRLTRSSQLGRRQWWLIVLLVGVSLPALLFDLVSIWVWWAGYVAWLGLFVATSIERRRLLRVIQDESDRIGLMLAARKRRRL